MGHADDQGGNGHEPLDGSVHRLRLPPSHVQVSRARQLTTRQIILEPAAHGLFCRASNLMATAGGLSLSFRRHYCAAGDLPERGNLVKEIRCSDVDLRVAHRAPPKR
jgi:hypothetical protein